MTKFARLFVWLGGVLFVASLGFCAYTYLVTWSGSDPSRLSDDFGGRGAPVNVSWANVAFDAMLFGIFAAHHSLFARARVKATLARLVPESLLRSVYVWSASLLLIVVC